MYSILIVAILRSLCQEKDGKEEHLYHWITNKAYLLWETPRKCFIFCLSILILLRCWVVNLFLRLFMDQFIYWLNFSFYLLINIHLWACKDYFERKYDCIILSTFKYLNVHINMYIVSLTFISSIRKLTNKTQANYKDIMNT